MSPAELLGQALTDARRAGDAFDAAWPSALIAAVSGSTTSDGEEWLDALGATRPVWEDAWKRRPATRAQRALVAVAEDPERVALEPGDDGTGYCHRCGTPLAAASGKHDVRAIYCGATCRKLASAARLAA